MLLAGNRAYIIGDKLNGVRHTVNGKVNTFQVSENKSSNPKSGKREMKRNYFGNS
jgi:hypothetical protein